MKILVTGGAGYIGSLLTRRLLQAGHHVTVLDALFYGRTPLDAVSHESRLRVECADICDGASVKRVLDDGFDQVIHLAAVSNDPSAALNPELTRRVNRDAVTQLMGLSRDAGVARFLYASSASVYGIKAEDDVHEDLPLEPMTDYARYKAEGEQTLWGLTSPSFVGVAVRSATVCGVSPRLRLDLTINILTLAALTTGVIKVFGGSQYRPNVHIDDLVDFYVALTTAPSDRVADRAFNVSRANATVADLALMVRDVVGEAEITTTENDDVRSYRLSAERARRELDFEPTRELRQAVVDLVDAWESGAIPDHGGSWYRNVQHMTRFADAFPFAPDSKAGPLYNP